MCSGPPELDTATDMFHRSVGKRMSGENVSRRHCLLLTISLSLGALAGCQGDGDNFDVTDSSLEVVEVGCGEKTDTSELAVGSDTITASGTYSLGGTCGDLDHIISSGTGESAPTVSIEITSESTTCEGCRQYYEYEFQMQYRGDRPSRVRVNHLLGTDSESVAVVREE